MCDQESKVIELSAGKRLLEDGEEEEHNSRKFFKPHMEETEHQGVHLLSLSQANQSDNQRDSNQSDTSFLISQIGRDMSIKSLVLCSRSDYGSIASLNRAFRTLIRSGEIYRLRRQKGNVEYWVYCSCILFGWEAFDPIRRRWMHLPQMEFNPCFLDGSLAVGTELLVFGREISSPVVYKYSILTNSWLPGTRPNTPRSLFASASLGEIAIIAGGFDHLGNILSSAELYDSETGTWVAIPSMNKPRKICSGVFLDRKFYVVGGIGIGVGNLEEFTCGEVYDLDARTWTVIDNMFPRRGDALTSSKPPPLVAVVRNTLYAADYAEHELKKYDKETNLWVAIGRLPDQLNSVNGWGIMFRACGEQLIVITGPNYTVGETVDIYSWVPCNGVPQWNLLTRRNIGGFVYNCAVLGC